LIVNRPLIKLKLITDNINNLEENKIKSTTTDSSSGDVVSEVSHIAENFYSGVRTRTPIESPILYNKKPKLSSVPESLKMDFSRILNKPFFIKNISWDTAAATHSQIGVIGIPSEILVNALAKIPFQSAAFFRSKVVLIMQVSGTPMHQGIVLASAIPRLGTIATVASMNVNRALMAPHVFLSANEATPVILEVPFYSPTKLRNVDLLKTTVGPENPTLDYAQVALQVMSPLAVAASGTTTVTISIHAMFTDMDFYVPHTDPGWVAQGFMSDIRALATKGIDGTFGVVKQLAGDFLDTARRAANNGLQNFRDAIRLYTGLHAPELPLLSDRSAVQFRQNTNLVDAPSFFEKMDPFSSYTRIVDDYYFDTDIDEMDMRFLLSKPQFIGSFKVSYNTTVNTLLWSRPITPVQMVYDSPPNNYTAMGNTALKSNWSTSILQNFSYLSKFWKGGLKLHIQMSASSLSFAKLAVVRNYSPDQNMLASAPAYTDVQNLLTEHVEFSCGGQVQTIDLPYCSVLSQLPCTSDWVFNAIQHGMYYIFLAQPLTLNATLPNDVRFNIYISAADDFTFMGYATRPVNIAYPFLQSNAIRNDDAEEKFTAEATTLNPVNSQFEITNKQTPEIKPDLDIDFRPIVSVRDYIRRFHKVYSQRIKPNQLYDSGHIIKLEISDLVGNVYTTTPSQVGFPTFDTHIFASPSNPMTLINNMFYGYSGGYKFKLNIIGADISELWYVPPDYCFNKNTNRWNSTYPVQDGAISAPIDEAIVESFRFPSGAALLLSRDNPRTSNPTVEIERPNYGIGTASALLSEENTVNVAHMFECEVPNMTPFRFVANNNKYFHGTTDSTSMCGGDMGYFLIRIAPLYYAGENRDAMIEVMVAATDEGRLGYHWNAPVLALPVIPGPGTGDNNYQVIPAYNRNNYNPPYALVGTLAPGAYKGSYLVP